MKILLASDYFYPYSIGGTEQYVYELAQGLLAAGMNVSILTIAEQRDIYHYQGLTVYAVPMNTHQDKNTIAGLAPSDNLSIFIEVLKELDPDVVHFHTLTTSLGTFHYEAARRAGVKVIFTSHIPGNTCLRGDLMKFGKSPCNGQITNTCLACYLNFKGLPKLLSPAAAAFLQTFKSPKILSNASLQKKHQLDQINIICSRVITMSNWQQQTFLINGFTPRALFLSRHTFTSSTYRKRLLTDHNLTIGFAGRISPEKGLHLLIEAFKRLHDQRFTLEIAAIKTSGQGEYLSRLLSETKALKNVHWNFEYTPNTMNDFYKKINVLCIPSVLHETGPYVMFESIGRQIPVIASNLGGMREWAGFGYPVTVYAHKHVNELFHLLNNLPASVDRSYNYPPNRTVHDIVREMIKIYNNDD